MTSETDTNAKAGGVLVYGGSFDPPHKAHIELPFQVLDGLPAERVVFVPAGTPPHKRERCLVASHHRLSMLQLALRDKEKASYEIDTFEIDHEDRVSFTVTTLEHLQREMGAEARIFFMMGADMAVTFYSWYKPHRILELARPVVILRSTETIESVLSRMPVELSRASRDFWRSCFVDVELMDISSTELRDILATGSISHPKLNAYLDSRVLEYIREHGLYLNADN